MVFITSPHKRKRSISPLDVHTSQITQFAFIAVKHTLDSYFATTTIIVTKRKATLFIIAIFLIKITDCIRENEILKKQ